uniref:SCP domain-containing protein n=1 Tax=Parastrongyloides trichosuri TaxID=131310 RepID=A0A0N4Z8H4_PARTI
MYYKNIHNDNQNRGEVIAETNTDWIGNVVDHWASQHNSFNTFPFKESYKYKRFYAASMKKFTLRRMCYC